MKQTEYRIIKEDTSEVIGNFTDQNEAYAFLKDKVFEDEDEFSHRKYCLTKFELAEIQGKENWVLNEKFGRRRITAKTAKGLLDDLI
jgi:hypothetical protein